jgi:hypothetical protein
VTISQDLTPGEEKELLPFLDKNIDVFAWRISELTGVSRDIIEHKLYVNPSTRPKKQWPLKMSDEKVAAAKAEAQRLLDAGFICEVYVTPGSKAKPSAHSMCAQESSLHTYRTENRYRITNAII